MTRQLKAVYCIESKLLLFHVDFNSDFILPQTVTEKLMLKHPNLYSDQSYCFFVSISCRVVLISTRSLRYKSKDTPEHFICIDFYRSTTAMSSQMVCKSSEVLNGALSDVSQHTVRTF